VTNSRSTLDDEVDDEPVPDSRETCWFWESRAGKCHFEPLRPGSEPCSDCPDAMEDFAAYLVKDMGYTRNPCPEGCPHEVTGHVHLHSPGNPASIGIPPCDFILWADGSSTRG
jgi:hypothetical protein